MKSAVYKNCIQNCGECALIKWMMNMSDSTEGKGDRLEDDYSRVRLEVPSPRAMDMHPCAAETDVSVTAGLRLTPTVGIFIFTCRRATAGQR